MLAGVVLSTGAQAQQPYPNKPIRLVTGFAPGSATDSVARLLAEPLGAALGQQIIVDNRPGVASTLATAQVARAPADGYTLMLGTNSALATGPAGVIRNVGYDPVRDFTPIGRVATVSFMLVGNTKLAPKTLPELIDYTRRNPDRMNCASGNTNGIVFCELFKQRIGASVLAVPYKSTPPALTDLIGGQVQVMFVDVPTGGPRVLAGQVHPYAVTSRKRSSVVPDVPTMAEAGLRDFPENSGWWGLYGPAGLPKNVVARLVAALDEALKRPDVQSRLQTLGVELSPAPPEELDAFLRSQLQDWARFLKDFNIAPEN
jgi:tripartite-type tricarboxylate transporter receptor subunit TctC